MNVHGIFNLWKPPGLTSFDVVHRVRHLSGQWKVGHAGTLDPLASGVLVVCLGQATRLTPYLAEHRKVYLAEITLGQTTDTYDAEGRITSETAFSPITRETAEGVLSRFIGPIRQRPPLYSAVKRDGTPLYRLARAGVEVEPPWRWVTIHRLELLLWSPPTLQVLVECSRGTYIRSLAHDVGYILGCGAFLSYLVRLRSGPFCLEDSLSLDELAHAFTHNYWLDLLYPLDAPLLDRPAVILGHERSQMAKHGIPLSMRPVASSHEVVEASQEGRRLARGYSVDGELLALLRADPSAGLWRVVRVFDRPVD